MFWQCAAGRVDSTATRELNQYSYHNGSLTRPSHMSDLAWALCVRARVLLYLLTSTQLKLLERDPTRRISIEDALEDPFFADIGDNMGFKIDLLADYSKKDKQSNLRQVLIALNIAPRGKEVTPNLRRRPSPGAPSPATPPYPLVP